MMINEGKIMIGKYACRIRVRHRLLGFTLIELLVVVAIIALLMSILLPSLKKARDQAKSAVCASQLSQLIRAEITYEEQYKGWIPGTALTTGYWFVVNPKDTNDRTWMAGSNGQPRLVNWFDWFTPLRIQMHGAKSLPYDQIELFKQGVDGVFNCPANPHIATWEPYWSTGYKDPEVEIPGPPIRAISYLPMQNIMLPALTALPASVKNLPGFSGIRITQDTTASNKAVNVPDSYLPRRSKLGRPSVKAFLVDGTRTIKISKEGDILGVKYKTPMRGSRCGVYPRTVPCEEVINKIGWPDENKTWMGAWTAGRKFSYRHGDNNSMNAAFFDGHVQSLWVNDHNQGVQGPYKDFSGPAVTPYYYYPSGSIVNKPNLLFKDTIPQGIKLQ